MGSSDNYSVILSDFLFNKRYTYYIHEKLIIKEYREIIQLYSY